MDTYFWVFMYFAAKTVGILLLGRSESKRMEKSADRELERFSLSLSLVL